jgi:hypothetical protein
MQSKNRCVRLGFSALVCGFLAILLSAAPSEGKTVESNETLDLNYEVLNDSLGVYGTLNMLPGAYVDWGIYAWDGSTVNVYAGSIGVNPISGPYPLVVSNGATVSVYGTNFAEDGVPVSEGQWTPNGGSGTLTGTYENNDPIELLFQSDIPVNLVDTGGGGTEEITIDIKPGSYPNTINLGSQGVVPVAILSDLAAGFDATTVDADKVFLEGTSVAVRGKGNKYMAHQEDVNGDGETDLVVQIDTENLQEGEFQDGIATLTIEDGNGSILYEGSDEITIVPPE